LELDLALIRQSLVGFHSSKDLSTCFVTSMLTPALCWLLVWAE